MILNEKVKFGTNAIYDLAVNGISFDEDKARVVFVLPEGKTYEQVEADVTGKERIEILDSMGDVLEARSGYIYLDSLTKKKDYIIGTEQVENGTNEDTGETIYLNQDVTATVMIVTLKREDVRQEIADVKETVDMLVMESLGV